MRQTTGPVIANSHPTNRNNGTPRQVTRVLMVGVKPENSWDVRERLLQAHSLQAEIIEAGALPEALALLAGEKFHIALLDLTAPSLNLDDLRSIARTATDMPIIAFGDTYNSALAVEALQAGAEDFLAWDELDSRELERAISHACERKRAESDLRSSEVRFRALFEQSPNPICIHRSDGLSVQINQSVLDRFDMTREQASRYNVLQDRHLLVQDGMAAIHSAFSGEASTIPLIKFSSDEHGWADKELTRWLKGVAYPIKDQAGEVDEVVLIWEDVTAQEEAESKLRQTESQYQSVFEATTDGLVINAFGNVVEVNPAFAEMHGYTCEEMVGMDPAVFVHPDSMDLVREFFQAVQAGGQYHCEAVDIRKDSSTFPVEVHGTSFNYGGEPHVLGIIRDITERVEADKLVRLKEEQYRAIFEATTDGLVINSLDGRVVEVNPAFAEMHGYTVREMDGMSPFTFVHPAYHARVPEFFAAVREGMQYQETKAEDIRKDGTVFPVEVHGTLFTYRGEPHLLSIVRDITERVQTEEQIGMKEAQYRAVFEATTDGLAIADLSTGTLVEVNPSFAAMHGYTREEMVGMHPSVFVHPDDYEVQGEFMERARQGERAYAEGRDVRKDGTSFNIEVQAAPFIHKNQPHVLAIMRDSTERVQARELLEQRVEERTRELAMLLEVSSNVASTLELEPLLDRILEQFKHAASYSRASIMVLGEPDREAIVRNAWGSPTDTPLPPSHPIKVDQFGPLGERMRRGEAIVVADIHSDEPMAKMLHNSIETALSTLDPEGAELLRATIATEHSMLFAPILVKGKVVGGLTLRHNEPDYYTERHAELAKAIGNQAAIAVENSRLLAQTHDKARLEERQRLARELHDSVTQALFSTNLIARSLEMLLQREGTHSPDVMDKITDLRQLTHGALAEMRALIFELRPGALEEEGLMEALRKHAAGIQGRQELQVDVTGIGEGTLPRLKPAAEEALYRIAQEALHNVVKHARATRVAVSIGAMDGFVTMQVSDNGIGFNVQEVPAGHMGLGTMGQRARALHAEYLVTSRPGEGTSVTVRVPLSEWQLTR
ncbi:MAG TPA: PAS domain S-box protein [Chloroflexia bacterium]|nr:PAS domain S-box protein [Chloroflexia bacterium]